MVRHSEESRNMKATKVGLIVFMLFAVADSLAGIGTKITSPTSMLNLVANPEKYDGKRVATVGFLEIESNRSTLYLHREDRDHNLLVNGLNVVFDPELTDADDARFNLIYVYLSGTFDAKDRGFNSLAGGSIKSCSVVILWPGPEERDKK
jgi:hypothetical protein